MNKDVMSSVRAISPALWDLLARRYSTKDVEVALTRLDMDILASKQRKVLEALRRKAESTLTEFFARFRYNDRILTISPWLLPFINKVFEKGDVVVSLNYDCLLEGALDRCKLWSPVEGYGRSGAIASVPTRSPPSPVRVLKIHGSENFHRDRIVDSQPNTSFSFTVDESIFPLSGKLRHFCPSNAHSSPAVIAPSFVKIFPSSLLSVFLEALDVAKQASTIVLIGCGLRREDAFLYLLLWHFIRISKRIVIVDPFATGIGKRLSGTFEYDIGRLVHAINSPLSDGWEKLAMTLKTPKTANNGSQRTHGLRRAKRR